MSLPGGSADKLGNRFEGHWTVLKMLELLDERHEGFTFEADTSIELASGPPKLLLEPPGALGHKVEFVLKCGDGVTEHHQVKTRGRGRWTLEALEREGLLSAFGDKLNDSQVVCVFVSDQNADDLSNLAGRARSSESLEEFEQSLSTELRTAWNALGEKFWPGCAPENALNRLRRLEVRIIDSQSLLEQVHSQILSRVDGELDLIRLALAELAVTHIHRSLSAAQVWHELEQKGFTRRDWHRDPRLSRKSDAVTELFLAGAADEREGWLERSEVETTLHCLQNVEGKRVIVLTGSAGMGKSAVTHEVVQRVRAWGWPTLAFRLDRVESVSTAAKLGEVLGLPESPLEVLARVAGERSALLVIDQLDTVSNTSGRNPQVFEVVTELLRQARAYPDIWVLLACRSFDLQHDDRFQKLVKGDRAPAQSLEVSPLSKEQVRGSLTRLNLLLETLNPRQLELFGVPLHLKLLEQVREADRSGVQTVTDLYERFWHSKERQATEHLGHPVMLAEVLYPLARRMSRKMSLFLPRILLDDYGSQGKALVSEGVLRQDERHLSFFHEGFFDYCFAKQFLSGEQTLLEVLLSGEQHLFRRAQVRQILNVLRDQDFTLYLSTLEDLLYSPDVRFHLKQVVYALLATLEQPTPEESTLVVRALEGADQDLTHETYLLPRFSLGWFRLFEQRGLVKTWFESSDEQLGNHAVWTLLNTLERSSDDYLNFVETYLGRSELLNTRIVNTLGYTSLPTEHRFLAFFIRLIELNLLNDEGVWLRLSQVAQKDPVWACEAVQAVFERALKEARQHSGKRLMSRYGERLMEEDYQANETLSLCATHAPETFLERVLPQMLEAAFLVPTQTQGPFQRDAIWDHRMARDSIASLANTVSDAIIAALERLETADFQRYASLLRSSLLEVAQFILLRAYKAHAAHCADEALEFLCAEPERFRIGYFTQSEWVSHDLLRAVTPHASPEALVTLEATVLSYIPQWEKDPRGRKFRGQGQLSLLEGIAPTRRSKAVRAKVKRLRRKFPELNTEVLEPAVRGGYVGPPVPQNQLEQFTDAQWLEAMQKFDDDERKHIFLEDSILGGSLQLAQAFQAQVKLHPERFARLLLEMPDTLKADYFEWGVMGLRKAELPPELVLEVARKCHALPGRPCGRWLPDLFADRPEQDWPEEALAMVSWYALEDPDPTEDQPDRDPHTAGINSVRGQAAEAVGQLLFAQPQRLDFFKSTLERLTKDPLVAVRACAGLCVNATLNVDRDYAVSLFLELVECRDELLGARYIQDFMWYALSTHYRTLEPVLERMCRSILPEIAQAGARLASLVAFNLLEAEGLAQQMFEGSEDQRRGAAEVYSHNLDTPHLRERCTQRLEKLFTDASAEVRKEAAKCFRGGAALEPHLLLISTFIGSSAFQEEPFFLLHHLKNSSLHLPEIVIDVAEHYLLGAGPDAADLRSRNAMHTSTVSGLVMKVYSQALNRPATQAPLFGRCLNLFDQFAKWREYEFSKAIEAYER